jgi:hypothetical protein
MTTMSAAQLIIMAVIVLALMAIWLSLVFLADREPRRPRQAPTGTPAGGQAGAVPGEGTALVPPPRRPGDEGAVEQVPEHAIEGEPERVPPNRVMSRG